VVSITSSFIRKRDILISEEINQINKTIRFELRDGEDTLAVAEISTAGDVWVFTGIFVSGEYRANGYGSDLLTKLIEYLDINNIDLFAYIYSYGSLSERHLDAWYRRYGFVDAGEEGYQLARYAGSRHNNNCYFQNRGD
jgi:GNAT superfamily N-acetyltransferase